MSDKCIFVDAGDGWCECECGRRVRSADCSTWRAYHLGCKPPKSEIARPGLGDRVKSALDAVGITPERVDSVLGKIGLPGCGGGCEKRRQWLNQVGDELGEAAKSAVAKLFGIAKIVNLDNNQENNVQ